MCSVHAPGMRNGCGSNSTVEESRRSCRSLHGGADGNFVNLCEAWHILRQERPSLVLSTGAGPAVPFALVGKLFRIPTLFIETFTRVTEPSLAGKLMYYLADRFFYQWRPLGRFLPKGIYGGPLV